MTKPTNSELAQVARAALDYIDALPGDVVAKLPVMPGFDRDWAENAIADAQSVQQKYDEAISELAAVRQQLAAVTAENVALTAENKKAVDAVTVFSNVTRDITEIICDELGHDRVAEILAAYNDLGNMPATDAALAEISA